MQAMCFYIAALPFFDQDFTFTYQSYSDRAGQGGTTPETNEIVTNICSCHNFFSLSSVQIIFIPACCLLCVL